MSSLDKRWLALIILCLGDLMIVLDTTIVNVALPSMKAALGFSDTSLVWVVNAYMITFSGFLLLGGRLGDLYGQRKLFLGGLGLFTFASLMCGIADSQTFLIAARAAQGIGGAVVSAIALSLLVSLFTEEQERAKAMGYFGFISAGGGAVGVFLGGLLTGFFDWHIVFLVNIPIGIIVAFLALRLLPPDPVTKEEIKLDVLGAITITASLMLAVYGIVSGNGQPWTTLQSLFVGIAIALFALFVYIERNVASPLMPLHIFKNRNVALAGAIGVLWSAAMFAWFFLSALYMQLVLGYAPLMIGLAFLPGNVIMAVFSLGLSAYAVTRFGIRRPLAVGMSAIGCGLLLFAFAPADGTFLLHVLPGMVLMGSGAGLAFNPVLLGAMNSVPEHETGLASGVLNTGFMMGGSLGLAVLASLAASHTTSLGATGMEMRLALNEGYHLAFAIGAACSFAAAIIGGAFMKGGKAEVKGGVH